jgi:hypothetical protein
MVRPDRPWQTKSQWFSYQRDFEVKLFKRHAPE